MYAVMSYIPVSDLFKAWFSFAKRAAGPNIMIYSAHTMGYKKSNEHYPPNRPENPLEFWRSPYSAGRTRKPRAGGGVGTHTQYRPYTAWRTASKAGRIERP